MVPDQLASVLDFHYFQKRFKYFEKSYTFSQAYMIEFCTAQYLYTTPHYNTDLDITLSY